MEISTSSLDAALKAPVVSGGAPDLGGCAVCATKDCGNCGKTAGLSSADKANHELAQKVSSLRIIQPGSFNTERRGPLGRMSLEGGDPLDRINVKGDRLLQGKDAENGAKRDQAPVTTVILNENTKPVTETSNTVILQPQSEQRAVTVAPQQERTVEVALDQLYPNKFFITREDLDPIKAHVKELAVIDLSSRKETTGSLAAPAKSQTQSLSLRPRRGKSAKPGKALAGKHKRSRLGKTSGAAKARSALRARAGIHTSKLNARRTPNIRKLASLITKSIARTNPRKSAAARATQRTIARILGRSLRSSVRKSFSNSSRINRGAGRPTRSTLRTFKRNEIKQKKQFANKLSIKPQIKAKLQSAKSYNRAALIKVRVKSDLPVTRTQQERKNSNTSLGNNKTNIQTQSRINSSRTEALSQKQNHSQTPVRQTNGISPIKSESIRQIVRSSATTLRTRTGQATNSRDIKVPLNREAQKLAMLRRYLTTIKVKSTSVQPKKVRDVNNELVRHLKVQTARNTRRLQSSLKILKLVQEQLLLEELLGIVDTHFEHMDLIDRQHRLLKQAEMVTAE